MVLCALSRREVRYAWTLSSWEPQRRREAEVSGGLSHSTSGAAPPTWRWDHILQDPFWSISSWLARFCLLSVTITVSFVSHTGSRRAQWKDTPPPHAPTAPSGFSASRHLHHGVEMKVPLWALLPWSKGLGCCSLYHYRPTVLLFLALSLHGWGSKLITVSFRLQSCVCSSCWGWRKGGWERGVLGWEKEEELPHPQNFPPLIIYRLQKLELLFSTHLFPYESLVLILTPRLYSSLSDPPHVFHICFYVWIYEQNC